MSPEHDADAVRPRILIVLFVIKVAAEWVRERTDYWMVVWHFERKLRALRRDDVSAESQRVNDNLWRLNRPRKYWKSCYSYDHALGTYELLLDEIRLLQDYGHALLACDVDGISSNKLGETGAQIAYAWLREEALRPKIAERNSTRALYKKHSLEFMR